MSLPQNPIHAEKKTWMAGSSPAMTALCLGLVALVPWPRRFVPRHRGREGNGRHRAALCERGRRRDLEAGRQCDRRSGRGRLRARRRQPVLRQYRRRRLHDRSSEGWPRHLHQFSRNCAEGGDRDDVSRWQRRAHRNRQSRRLSRGRRPGDRCRARLRAE